MVVGATVTVHVKNASPGTGALANIYSDDGVTLIGGSAVTTDSTGTFDFYAPDGRYDLVVLASGVTKTVADLLIQDVTEANSGDATLALNGTIGSTTPNTGAFTSITAGSGGIFANSGGATTSEKITLGRTTTDATFAIPGGAGLFAANAAQGDLVIRNEAAARSVFIGPLLASGALPVSVNNTGVNLWTSTGTLPADVFNDGSGNIVFGTSGGKQMVWASTGLFTNPGLGVNFQGATSGSTSLQATAISSGTLTLPAATDTLVGRATTDTLTNKTLGGAGSTTPDTKFNRLKSAQGSALIAGDFAISASWGSTASIASVSGTDAAGSITILTGGTGIAANPSITLTFHDGTWTNPPIVVCSRGDVQTAGHVAAVSVSATQVIFTVNTTPNSGQNYPIYFICIGR